MSKSPETTIAELQAIYNQLTTEEKKLLAKKKQDIIDARGTESKSTYIRKD